MNLGCSTDEFRATHPSLPLNLRQHHKYQYHKKGNLTVKIKTTNEYLLKLEYFKRITLFKVGSVVRQPHEKSLDTLYSKQPLFSIEKFSSTEE